MTTLTESRQGHRIGQYKPALLLAALPTAAGLWVSAALESGRRLDALDHAFVMLLFSAAPGLYLAWRTRNQQTVARIAGVVLYLPPAVACFYVGAVLAVLVRRVDDSHLLVVPVQLVALAGWDLAIRKRRHRSPR